MEPPAEAANTNDTPKQEIVKVTLKPDRPGMKKLEIRLQGLILIAFEEALTARHETGRQLITDLLENYLIKEGYLPSWYKERGRGIT